MFFPQEAQSFVVEIIRPPAEELTVVDVLVGAFGLAGVFALAAVPLGLAAGFLMIRWNRHRRPDSEHMPHIAPSMQLDASPADDASRGPSERQ